VGALFGQDAAVVEAHTAPASQRSRLITWMLGGPVLQHGPTGVGAIHDQVDGPLAGPLRQQANHLPQQLQLGGPLMLGRGSARRLQPRPDATL
jgi:hypothetical protein